MRRADLVNHYSVVLSSEGGVWLVEVPALKGVRSFGRTIPAAVGNIREAIAAAEDLDDWEHLPLVVTFDDAAASAAIERLGQARLVEEEASAASRRAVGEVIKTLRDRGMSYRDIAAVIGLSHQRVAQIDAELEV